MRPQLDPALTEWTVRKIQPGAGQLNANSGSLHVKIAAEGISMRSPDLPEIVIAAGLVAYIACAVHNWLHRRKGQRQRSRSNSYAEKAAQASERAPT